MKPELPQFKARIGKSGEVKVPLQLLNMCDLTEGDMGNFEILPTKESPIRTDEEGRERVDNTSHEIEVKMRMAEAEELGNATFNAYLPMWITNFRANLDLLTFENVKQISQIPTNKGKKCIVAGAGPTLAEQSEEDWQRIRNWDPDDGIIIVSNKALIPFLKHRIVPDYVVALDGLPVVYESFNSPLVRSYKKQIAFIGPTVLDPKVTRFVLKWAKQCYFGNPHMPSGQDTKEWNLNLIMQLMNNFEMMRHGGNVATCAWLVANGMKCNPIALLGMDMCMRPSPKWSKAETLLYQYQYNPEMDEMLALDAPFRAYLQILYSATDMAWNEKPYTATINLTPRGALRSSGFFPTFALKDFIELPAKTIARKAKKMRDDRIALSLEKIKAVREAAKPIFRSDF